MNLKCTFPTVVLGLLLVSSIVFYGCKKEKINTPPTISIASPEDGVSITHGSEVTIRVNAADSDGNIAGVGFFVDGISAEIMTSSPYVFQWQTNGVAEGSHVIKATATDDGGSMVSAQITINLGNLPIADFISDKTNDVAPLTVNFTDLSTNNPSSWEWDFGDGAISTEQNPSHNYEEVGSYSVSLTVTNLYGSDSELKTNYISVVNVEKATLSTTIVSYIEAKTAVFSASIIDDGNTAVLDRGFVWSKETNPTINDNIIVDSYANSEEYSSAILDLDPNTEYFVKAYAKNSLGIAYGPETSFNTKHYIHEGFINLKSQYEIIEFGKKGYTQINGTIAIGVDQLYALTIASLEPLSSLNSITGVLRIEWTPNLISLKGLENITSIGGIYITHTSIENLDELINVSSLDGGASGSAISMLLDNNSLTNIDGLKNIETISSYFELRDNPLLLNLDGLSSLKSVKTLVIERHPSLSNINGLSNLTTIGRDLVIQNNSLLINLDGLNNLKSIERKCEITRNFALVDFCAINSILISDPNLEFEVSLNAYNPSKQDLIDGNCKQ